jgi:hypothetical protein
MVITCVLDLLDESDYTDFIWPIADWIMIIVPMYLLFIWLRSMTGRLQSSYSQHFSKFIYVWLVLFTIVELLLCVSSILWFTSDWYEIIDYYHAIWTIARAVEVAGFTLFLLLCSWILLKLQNFADSEILLKRRQLLTILLIYFTLLVSPLFFLAAHYSDLEGYYYTVLIHIGLFASLVYYVVTIFPRDAITGFSKVPGLPTAVPDQPTFVPVQPTFVMGQPTFMPGQPIVVTDQPTFIPSQPIFVPSQPAIITGQPIFVPDQSTFVIGQPNVTPDQPIYVQGQTSCAGPAFCD